MGDPQGIPCENYYTGWTRLFNRTGRLIETLEYAQNSDFAVFGRWSQIKKLSEIKAPEGL